MVEPTDGPLAGYETGPDATRRATAAAWNRLTDARAVVLVEGVSDQIAVESAARMRDHDLATQRVVVMPIGGAHAIARTLAELGARAPGIEIGGLCDVAEESFVARALGAQRRAELARHGFFVCEADLEDELLRAAGRPLVERVVAEQGEERALATMRRQPGWHDRPFDAQFRRFCGARSQRKHRYAAAIVDALGPDALPTPLTNVLAHVAVTR